MASRVSTTILGYTGRQFLFAVLTMFVLFLAIVFLMDIIELMRRAAGRDDVPFTTVLDMALFKLPHMGQELLPFAVLFGTMFAFWRLNRSSELVAVRATGVSIWQFLLPVLMLALLLGAVKLAFFNPMAAAMVARFEQLENEYLRRSSSRLAVSRTGLWLRQADAAGQSVVHAETVSSEGLELSSVIVFFYEEEDQFVGRADATSARLEEGFWELEDVWLTGPRADSRHEDNWRVATDLTFEHIEESFASPETISFWELPEFIEVLDQTGFSSIRHRMRYQSLLAEPLLLCAMTLIAAVFALRYNQRSGTTVTIIGGIVSGFLLYFISDIVSALGLSASIPVGLAAWTPAGVSALLGVSVLFHLEDG